MDFQTSEGLGTCPCGAGVPFPSPCISSSTPSLGEGAHHCLLVHSVEAQRAHVGRATLLVPCLWPSLALAPRASVSLVVKGGPADLTLAIPGLPRDTQGLLDRAGGEGLLFLEEATRGTWGKMRVGALHPPGAESCGLGEGSELQGHPWGQVLRGEECVKEERDPLRAPCPHHHHLPRLKPHQRVGRQRRPWADAPVEAPQGGTGWVTCIGGNASCGEWGPPPAVLRNRSHSWGHGP